MVAMMSSMFAHWDDYRRFERYVLGEYRHVFNETVNGFLDSLLRSSESRAVSLRKGHKFFRAQLGTDWDDEHGETALPEQRMKPNLHCASEGRVNPKGILCLYLSNDEDTAMAEMRPSGDSGISLGQFKLTRDVKIIACTEDDKKVPLAAYLKKDWSPSLDEIESYVWADINSAFSKPVSRTETTADYAPTQIMSELFKQNGFDGVAYKSSFGKGYNIALFDLGVADLIGCGPFEVKSLKYEFVQCGKHYAVSRRSGPRSGEGVGGGADPVIQ